METKTQLHLKSFKTDLTLCDLQQKEVIQGGGKLFSTVEDLEESCTEAERKAEAPPEAVCKQCLKLGLLIPLRRSFQ